MALILGLIGVLLVVAGTTIIYWPAGLIVAGAFALFFAYTEG